MITKNDLDEAIAEYEGIKNPNRSTCLYLECFYALRDRLFPSEQKTKMAAVFDSDTEFGAAVRRNSIGDVLRVVDELMEALQMINPKLYDAAMEKLR